VLDKVERALAVGPEGTSQLLSRVTSRTRSSVPTGPAISNGPRSGGPRGTVGRSEERVQDQGR